MPEVFWLVILCVLLTGLTLAFYAERTIRLDVAVTYKFSQPIGQLRFRVVRAPSKGHDLAFGTDRPWVLMSR